MLFQKYQVVLIKEKSGVTRTISFNTGYIVAIFLLISVLLAGNIFFFQSFKENVMLRAYADEKQIQLEESQAQILAMASEVKLIQENLSRIQSFNSKLSIIADLETEPVEENIGGSSITEANLDNLPLHRQNLASRKIRTYLEDLAVQAKLEEVRQQEILLGLREHEQMLAALPSITPVEGFLTSKFGRRKSPFGTGKVEFHKGIDIAAPTGTPIIAPASGTVTKISTNGAYGKAIEITHGSGISTKYAHMHSFNVEKGDKVSRYDVIGTVGSTGRSTGPHLHYEVRLNGVATNPELYIDTKLARR